ncbi:hypothetical protein [Actinomadura opuntiae]|uniref:hypothetical protein n=1 Tax=Actinomadura sp. OS1-43 TaxID=604315 RepID=UPI00255B3DC1|nr:hypothetical protein [Actinomadura sp. OS1-43]MDL4820001.1 hypothetical protein [Actinomadura sp. OS1-43]
MPVRSGQEFCDRRGADAEHVLGAGVSVVAVVAGRMLDAAATAFDDLDLRLARALDDDVGAGPVWSVSSVTAAGAVTTLSELSPRPTCTPV